MAEPTQKSPQLENMLLALGFDRRPAIKQDICAKCGNDARRFKDEESEREYTMTGWCQRCQDIFYADLIDEDE